MIRFVAVGECMVELTRRDERTMALGYAGDTANTAVYLKRLGGEAAEVRFVTAVGDDPLSAELQAHLEGEGLIVDPQVVPGASPALYIVNTDEAGERTFTYYRESSPVRKLFADGVVQGQAAVFLSADLVYFSAITLQLLTQDGRRRLIALLEEARGRGSRIAFDSNYRIRGWPSREAAADAVAAAARVTDIALPSLADEQLLHPGSTVDDVIERYGAAGADEVVVKDGSNPTHVWVDRDVQRFDCVARIPVDTTGAGDSFNAAYLYGRASGLPVTEAVQAAQKLASHVIGHPGAIVPV
ncbi:sugar kinase [Diaminobutyricibacter sp. McL0608]|uniref:sugar kinase n=1 Tax=Leifsonia sp. McL0608 TaxID=3143537 RepID=UPI0031F30C1F